MFTGIITDIGKVRAIEQRGDTRFDIWSSYAADKIDIGASIACSGVCLTVVDKGRDGDDNWFAVDASAETLSLTSLQGWAEGSDVNLERSLKVGDELGGHIVSGHIDGVAEVIGVEPEGDSLRFTFEAPQALARFVAPKGSVALNGVSLTVNEVDGARFGVNIIPHTRAVTTFGAVKVGDRINFEVDVLARYVARLAAKE
jgi:riboflavin synthase